MSAPPPYAYSQPAVAPGYAAQAGYPPPTAGYPPPTVGYPPQQGLPYPSTAQPLVYPSHAGPAYAPGPGPAQPAVVVISGGCPSCRVGVMQDDFTCCGIFLAICFFPLGLLCCYALRQKRCMSCGYTIG